MWTTSETKECIFILKEDLNLYKYLLLEDKQEGYGNSVNEFIDKLKKTKSKEEVEIEFKTFYQEKILKTKISELLKKEEDAKSLKDRLLGEGTRSRTAAFINLGAQQQQFQKEEEQQQRQEQQQQHEEEEEEEEMIKIEGYISKLGSGM